MWNYYTDEASDSAYKIDNNDTTINNKKTTTSKSFEYKIKIIGSTPRHRSCCSIKIFE